MPLSFEPSLMDGRLSTVTLQDINISQKSILRASIKELYSSDQVFVPDHRLLNWTRCLQDRRRQHHAIEASTKRKPGEFCMNTVEDQRYLNEQKQILEFCQPPWPTKLAKLFDHGDTSSALCYGHPTAAARCVVTPMRYVGVATHIREEKDVLGQGDHKTAKEKWLYNPTVAKKLEQLDERFFEANPTEPSMDELAVVGNNMMRSVQLGSMIVPVISVYHENEFREIDDSVSSSSTQIEVSGRSSDEDTWACLKINERLLTWNSTPTQSTTGCSAFDGSNSMSDIDSALNVHKLFFKGDARQKLKEVVRFENIGNVKVRFSWQRKLDMDALPGGEAIHTSKFFFNKNSGVFLPGQIYHFPFWFETQRAGIFEEYWTLWTEPSLLRGGFKTCVQLYADASSPATATASCKHVTCDVDVYLARRELESAAAALAAELADRRRPLRPTPLYDFLLHRDAAFKDVDVSARRFGADLEARVRRTFSRRPLDQLRAQHRVAPLALKQHDYVHGLLGDAVDKMERHARRLHAVFRPDADADDDVDADTDTDTDADAEVANRVVLSILKSDASAALHHITFSDTREEFPPAGAGSGSGAGGAASEAAWGEQVVREALRTRMYFELCNAVEDAAHALDEASCARSAGLWEALPVDRMEAPPPATEMPAPAPAPGAAPVRLPRLAKVYDFEGRRKEPKKSVGCRQLEEMALTDYTFEQIGVEQLPPLPKTKEAKGKKGSSKDSAKSAKGAKGAKGKKGKK